MPVAKVGEKINIDLSNNQDVVLLKSKNDSIKFRLIPNEMGYLYTGKHWINDGVGWKVEECVRVTNKEQCATCDIYFSAKSKLKVIKDYENSKNKDKIVPPDFLDRKAEFEDLVKTCRPKINFYYPILDFEDGKSKMLQTVLSVRLKFDAEYADGINIYEFDYILKRTEKPGNDYYKLTRIDSKNSRELTDTEQQEMRLASSWNLFDKVPYSKSMVAHTKKINKENEEVIDTDDLPF